MKYLKNVEKFLEGRREKMAKTGNKNVETKEDKKLQTKDEIMKLLKSRENVKVKEDGANDLKVLLEDEHIIQVMIRDSKITIENKLAKDKKESKKDFDYEEWGKIKKEISSIIKESKPKKVNEEIAGIALLAGIGLAFAGSAIYGKAKQMWSKHITSKKYEKTGNKEEVKTADGKKQLIEEYKGTDGETYWGYDHQYDPTTGQRGGYEGLPSDDVYTAIFKAQDLERLKKYLQGIKVKTSITGADGKFKPSPEHDYLDKPQAVDMVYRKTLEGPGHGTEGGNY